jgi:hypothetical protein
MAKMIGTTRFGCGCIVHTEPDVNGITPWLEHCARHGAARELLAALEGLFREHADAHPQARECRCPHWTVARAAIAKAKVPGA